MISSSETCSSKVRRKPVFPRRVELMSKEVLRATLVKKRECNKRAQIIVERLLEDSVPQDWFLNSLQYISESHFQDVVEERTLAKLCGYPLCQRQLPPTPSQQFRISTRLNKVYDITDRKNFCSNSCYAAAKFLKQQLLTSPLWLRDKEEVPIFTLLPTAGHSEEVGDELDFCVAKVVADTSELSYHQDVVDKYLDAANSKRQATVAVSGGSKDSGSGIGVVLEVRKPVQLPGESGTGNDTLGSSSSRIDVSVGNPAPQNIEKGKVTIHTFAEETSKSISCDERLGGDFTASVGSESSAQLGDVACNEAATSENLITKHTVDLECHDVGKSTLHPRSLNSEHTSSACEIVVAGKMKMGLEDTVALQCEMQKLSLGSKKGWGRKGCEEPGPQGIVLYVEKCMKEWFTADTLLLLTDRVPCSTLGDAGVPLVDHHAQAALRRRIVLDRLNRVVPDLMAALGVLSCDISSEVRELVATFHLGAHNITFHVPEWNLVGLILINIVSLKNKHLQRQLRLKKVKDAQTLILLSFQQDSGYLDQLICWLTDVDHKTC